MPFTFIEKMNSLKSSISFMSVLFLLFSLSIFFDLYIVYFAGMKIQEYAMYIEGCIFFLGLVCFLINIKIKNSEKSLKVNHANEIKKILDQKTQVEIPKFENVIEVHFNVWELTEAEKNIATHLLKGLSIKEISEQRKVAEKTIRNQCFSIYTKSGLSGKHELAAYFLKEILIKS